MYRRQKVSMVVAVALMTAVSVRAEDAAPAEQAVVQPAPFVFSTESVSGTSWVWVDDKGKPYAALVTFKPDGDIDGRSISPLLDRWAIDNGTLTFVSDGGSVTYRFDQSSALPNAQTALIGHMEGEPTIASRLVPAVTGDALAAYFAKEALAGTAWRLSNDNDSVAIEKLTLNADGSVGGVAGNPWIATWTIEENGLVLLSPSGSRSFKFETPTLAADGSRVINGYLAINPYEEPYLTEIKE